GMKIEFSGEYGAWQPNFSSPIAAKMIEVYRDLFGEEAKTKVIHAGLECSMIGNIYPSMDMVSFGPTIRCPHTPDECCNIPSVARFWEFLKALLSQVPDKK
ncbi:MAG: M20/M25/M40 family metallo-hydrolase, partial [Paraprevotella sp.]|nr:M20/M25/M40 family metallo-hydrolase [Paraprevotella sp.]